MNVTKVRNLILSINDDKNVLMKVCNSHADVMLLETVFMFFA